jgi:hypothetical protein
MASTNAKRTAKRERDTWQFRFNLCAEVGRCERCGKRFATDRLGCHEILCGTGFRLKCLDQRCALLVLCNPCHREVQSWDSKPRQLARLYLSRPMDLDLLKLTQLWCRAPGAIEMAEIDAEIESLLGERE